MPPLFEGRIFLAGHRGLVGSAIYRKLLARGLSQSQILTQSSAKLDLRDQEAVGQFVSDQQPEAIILAAAKVGGIQANNTYPADFIYDNLMIQTNVINAAHIANVQRLLFLGSSCIYPKHAAQPMTEASILTGTLEPTNAPYAIAKIAGIKMCESYNQQYGRDYRSVMPTNLYGPGDNFHPDNSHVLPALLQRFHNAKLARSPVVEIWGSGTPRREFLHVDDMAEASLFVFALSSDAYIARTKPFLSHVNVGTGQDISIHDLAQMIAEVVGYEGHIETDPFKPDGAPRKLLDVTTLSDLGWQAKIGLKDGISQTYDWFLEHVASKDLRR